VSADAIAHIATAPISEQYVRDMGRVRGYSRGSVRTLVMPRLAKRVTVTPKRRAIECEWEPVPEVRNG
jgi:hypothetical protein